METMLFIIAIACAPYMGFLFGVHRAMKNLAKKLARFMPGRTDCVHEIKHDRYRIILRRDGPTVRLYT